MTEVYILHKRSAILQPTVKLWFCGFVRKQLNVGYIHFTLGISWKRRKQEAKIPLVPGSRLLSGLVSNRMFRDKMLLKVTHHLCILFPAAPIPSIMNISALKRSLLKIFSHIYIHSRTFVLLKTFVSLIVSIMLETFSDTLSSNSFYKFLQDLQTVSINQAYNTIMDQDPVQAKFYGNGMGIFPIGAPN